jgi:hypothetical protein
MDHAVLYAEYDLLSHTEVVAPAAAQRAAPNKISNLLTAALARARQPLQALDCLPPLELDTLARASIVGGFRVHLAPGDALFALVSDVSVAVYALGEPPAAPQNEDTPSDVVRCERVGGVPLACAPAALRHGAWSPHADVYALSLPGAATLGCRVPSCHSSADASFLTAGDRVVLLSARSGWEPVLMLDHAAFGVGSPAVSLAGLGFRAAAACAAGSSCLELVSVWHDATVRRLHAVLPTLLESDSESDAEHAPAELRPSFHSPLGARGSVTSIPFALLSFGDSLNAVTAVAVSDTVLTVAGRLDTQPLVLLFRLWDDFPFYSQLQHGLSDAPTAIAQVASAAPLPGLGVAPSLTLPLSRMLNPLLLLQHVRYARIPQVLVSAFHCFRVLQAADAAVSPLAWLAPTRQHVVSGPARVVPWDALPCHAQH